MKTKQNTFSVIIAMVAKTKKCFIKNKNPIDTYYYWKNWVDWMSTKQEKMLQPQKCTFSEKGPES